MVVDAKYKSALSSGNIQQVVAYCYLTGARRSVLVFPHGMVDTLGTSTLKPWNESAPAIRVGLAELRTDAKDVDGWRKNGRNLVSSVFANRHAVFAEEIVRK